MITTTFTKLRANGACESGYRKLAKGLGGVKHYGEDTPIPLVKILEINGLEDAIWSIRAADCKEEAVEFALRCAESVLPVYEAEYPGDPRVADLIKATREFVAGKITADELGVYREAIEAAARAARAAEAAGDAAWAAAWATEATARAADESARVAERKKQEQFFIDVFGEQDDTHI